MRKGKQDLSVLPDEPPRRVRQAGGGAKKTRTAPRVAGSLRPPAGGQHSGPSAGRGGEVDPPRPWPDRGPARW